MMYLDAVLDENLEVLFNGTPAETRKWISSNDNLYDTARVVRGYDLQQFSLEEYMEQPE